MSSISKLEEKVARMKAKAGFDTLLPKGSSWLSKKLLSMLAVVAGLIWLGRDNLALVIWGIVVLAGIYLVTQCINDAVHSVTEASVRKKLIDAMSADGLNEAEREALGIPADKNVIKG